jgi:DNA-directed RNA polymerase specialized sigma24 family protein
MSKYQDSDYALNKFSEGIVYRFADGVKEITLADYLRDNPGKTPADFAELKALSDEIYYEQDRADSAQTRKNQTIHGMEETERCATRPLEDELMERYVEIHNRRYAWQAVRALLEGTTLTEVQRRRFCLHIFKGRSTRQIARLEGISFQNVAKSINLAIGKLKKLFDELG